jgi:methyl-accepting chemotaxis protein
LQGVNGLLQQPIDQIQELTDVQLRSAREYGDAATGSYTVGLIVVLGLLAFSLVLAVVLAVKTLRRLQRSIGGLTRSAGRLAEGDLEVRCEVADDDDEFGRIGRSFDAMAMQLDALVSDARRRREELVATVDAVARFAESVADGDLTVRLALPGELQDVGEDLNRMVDGLAEISGHVQRGTSALTSSASQILAAVSHHNVSTADQAASIAQTSVTIDEVRANAEQASTRAAELADQARVAATYASQGSDAVAELVAGMDEIDVRVGVIAEGIRELSVRSEAIGAITASVRDLAEQSNMLALNATIEAAKAGEQGRGFAVVADEVRNLAEQSKQATVQVQQILVEIRDATKAAVSATDDGTRVVSQGRERAGRAGELIRQMSGSIEQTAVVASQIAMGAKEQAVGMDQIGDAIVSVSATTKQIARSAHQTEDAASGLTTIADELTQATSRYRLGATVPRPVGGPQ